MNALTGLAAIPWFTLGPWPIGPITIQGFGLMVAIGVILAYHLLGIRAERFGLSADTAQGLTLYMLIAGFLGSHFFDLLFYQPEVIFKNPRKLFEFGSSLSSYGGILGAMIGMVIWRWRNVSQPMMAYLDLDAFVLPVGWFFGRVGCAVVHDHPGDPSDFPLAIVFPDGIARHDLGLYEAMWWIVIVSIFFALHKAKGNLFQRRPGFFLALLPILYTPVRFGLDFMRKSAEEGGDARYLGLTPGQYASIAFFAFGVVLMARWAKRLTPQMPELTPKMPEPTPQTPRSTPQTSKPTPQTPRPTPQTQLPGEDTPQGGGQGNTRPSSNKKQRKNN